MWEHDRTGLLRARQLATALTVSSPLLPAPEHMNDWRGSFAILLFVDGTESLPNIRSSHGTHLLPRLDVQVRRVLLGLLEAV